MMLTLDWQCSETTCAAGYYFLNTKSIREIIRVK